MLSFAYATLVAMSICAWSVYGDMEEVEVPDAIYIVPGGRTQEFPWIVKLLVVQRDGDAKKTIVATGSLVREDFVVTAANLLLDNFVEVRASVGDTKFSNMTESKEIFIHPCYSKQLGRYDLAVIELKSSIGTGSRLLAFQVNRVQPQWDGTHVYVMGWAAEPNRLLFSEAMVLRGSDMESYGIKYYRHDYWTIKLVEKYAMCPNKPEKDHNKTIYCCQDKTLTLKCESIHQVLRILSVVYGRLKETICPIDLKNFTECEANNSKIVVAMKCNGLRECSIAAKYWMFGRICENVYKYLEVTYECHNVDDEPIISSYVCEDETVYLKCELPDHVIRIVSAVYGRLENYLCPKGPPLNISDCAAKYAASIVEKKCNGQQACSVEAKNKVFGDPCPGVYKYLEVKYECLISSTNGSTTQPTQSIASSHVPPTSPDKGTNITEIACQDFSLTLKCQLSNEVIVILYAVYGRLDITICAMANRKTMNVTDCAAKDSKTIVENNCNGLRECTVLADSSVFRNPCRGVWKYLKVIYTCRDSDQPVPEEEHVCEFGTLSLICESNNSVIRILTAVFGRLTTAICPIGNLSSTNCEAKNSKSVMEKLCNGFRECSVVASTSVFGEPCQFVSKYLEITYDCVNGGTTNGSTTQLTQSTASSHVPPQPPSTSQLTQSTASSHAPPQPPSTSQPTQSTASSHVPPNPPDEGTNKTECVCQDFTLTLKCQLSNEVIVILYAVYGRLNNTICVMGNRYMVDVTNCAAKNSKTIVENKCNGLRKCTVNADSSVFGNPCRGVWKYLEVIYTCRDRAYKSSSTRTTTSTQKPWTSTSTTTSTVPPPDNECRCLDFRTKIACQYSSLYLRCTEENHVIKIISANYGRTSSYSCKTDFFSAMDEYCTHCFAPNSKVILEAKCNGLSQCVVSADNSVFGDPCPRTVKYLIVQYCCEKIQRPQESNVHREKQPKIFGQGGGGPVLFHFFSYLYIGVANSFPWNEDGTLKHPANHSYARVDFSENHSWIFQILNDRNPNATCFPTPDSDPEEENSYALRKNAMLSKKKNATVKAAHGVAHCCFVDRLLYLFVVGFLLCNNI